MKIHTHLCEGSYEIDYAAEKFGKRPTEYLESMGVLSRHLHCAHSVLLSPEEIDLYVKHRLSACHCSFNNHTIGVPADRDVASRHRYRTWHRRRCRLGLARHFPGRAYRPRGPTGCGRDALAYPYRAHGRAAFAHRNDRRRAGPRDGERNRHARGWQARRPLAVRLHRDRPDAGS